MNFQEEDIYVACVRLKSLHWSISPNNLLPHNSARVKCEDFLGVAGSFFHRR